MPSLNHIHTYVRYKSRPGYYRCDAPDCTHFNTKEHITGKLSLCSLCGQQMILDSEALRRARPRCINCSDTKKAKIHRRAQELTRYLGTDSFSSLSSSLESSSEEPESFSLQRLQREEGESEE